MSWGELTGGEWSYQCSGGRASPDAWDTSSILFQGGLGGSGDPMALGSAEATDSMSAGSPGVAVGGASGDLINDPLRTGMIKYPLVRGVGIRFCFRPRATLMR